MNPPSSSCLSLLAPFGQHEPDPLDQAVTPLVAHTAAHPINIKIWHHRMGHMSYNALKRHKDAVTGLDLDASIDRDQSPCMGCELGKQMRLPFSASAKCSDQRLQIVHSDLCGPMQVQSIQGAKYFATFVDDYSRNGVVYFLKSKDQCIDALRKFLAWAETQTGEKMRVLHSDRRGEYMSGAFKAILDEKGIEHKLTMPGSP